MSCCVIIVPIRSRHPNLSSTVNVWKGVSLVMEKGHNPNHPSRSLILIASTLLASTTPVGLALPSPEPQRLVLNGEATRTFMGIGVYRVKLFLETRTKSSREVLASHSSSKRLEIALLRLIPSSKFLSAIEESIKKNFSPEEKGKICLGC